MLNLVLSRGFDNMGVSKRQVDENLVLVIVIRLLGSLQLQKELLFLRNKFTSGINGNLVHCPWFE